MTDDLPSHVLHRTGEDAVVVVYDDETVAAVYGYRNDGLPLGEVELHVQRRCDLGDVFLLTDCGCRPRLDRVLDRLDQSDRDVPGVLVYVERDDVTSYDAVAVVLRRLGVDRVRLLEYSVAEAAALRERGFAVAHGLEVMTASPPAPTDDAPIPALLPRDWPRQLDEFLDAMSASPAVRQAAYAFVDGWVLAAVEP